MPKNSNIISLHRSGDIDDPLIDILPSGPAGPLVQAIEIEAQTFFESMKDLKLANGRNRVVRHGHGPHDPKKWRSKSAIGTTRP
jgi:hypothetical protein